MAKYSKKAQKSVKDAMHEKKRGKLRSGSGAKVTSRKQAIAIGLSEAREKGAKVPAKKAGVKKAAKKSPGRPRKSAKKAAKKSIKKSRTVAGRGRVGRPAKKTAGKKAAPKKRTKRS